VKGKPYTRTGDIVIAVNPYEWIHSLYTPAKQEQYARKILWDYKKTEEDVRKHLEPHVYETSALSYRGLALDGMNQSILVSGESGAGKTETVKIAMNHIAMIQAGPNAKEHMTTSPVVQRVIESNPLLEAFGNAKTSRNDNSSRFGKYLQLQFETSSSMDMVGSSFQKDRSISDCKLAGSVCEVYLLEKSRVVHHKDSERNFHIFYQLLDSPDNVKGQFWNELCGKTAASYNYIGNSATTSIEGKSDADHFKCTIKSLAMVGIKGDSLHTLMRSIATVMQLGNIGFSGCSDRCDVSTIDELHKLACLIGVPADTLQKAFTQRTIKTRGESVKVDLNPDAAKESCDALAKSIYQTAFLWLVNKINDATKAENHRASSGYVGQYGVIGLLDIFGFECFSSNGFEQLCINYANEKLQHKFTEDIFRQVQAEYKAEGLAWADIRYDDNRDVLDLIESRMGLLAMLNEECVRPGGSDREFVFKAIQQNASSSALIISKKFSPLEFGVRHYAGNVKYTTGSFLTKNNDTLAADLKNCAGMSTNSIVANVFNGSDSGEKNSSRKSQNSISSPTVWTKYKAGLHSLMSELHKTNSRYIRCIKPNEMKLPRVMQHGPTLDQLRSAGVIAAVTITRSAFPNRLDHESVLERFRYLAKQTITNAPYREQVDQLLARLLDHMSTRSDNQVIKSYAVGKTRTYFRTGALEFLEAERIKGFDPAAVTIQRVARGFIIRKRQSNAYILKRNSAVKIQSIFRMLHAKQMYHSRMHQAVTSAEQNGAATLINALVRGAVRRVRFQKELKRYRAKVALKVELAELKRKVAESEEIKLAAVKAAEDRARAAMDSISNDDASSPDAVSTAKLLNERNAVIEKMRADNKRVRTNIKILENKFKHLREESNRLKEENDKETDAFLRLNGEAKAKNAEIEKDAEDEKVLSNEMTSLAEELKRTQTAFHETSDARFKYQKAMASIIKKLRTDCKDEQLVEDAIFIALDSDSEANAIKTSFDAVQAHLADKGKGAGMKAQNHESTEHTEDASSSEIENECASGSEYDDDVMDDADMEEVFRSLKN
jgi:myosin-5